MSPNSRLTHSDQGPNRSTRQKHESCPPFRSPFPPPEELIVSRIFILLRSILPSWVKQSLQLTPSAPSYICGVCYAARSSHVSHIVHYSYFNGRSYRKQRILLSQSRVEFLSLQKNVNVQIMRLLNPAWLTLSRRIPRVYKTIEDIIQRQTERLQK